jgi:hypothetical protein
VASVDAICAINGEFAGPQRADVREDFVRPGCGDVFVAKGGTAEFVAGFVGEDGRVFGVGELCALAVFQLGWRSGRLWCSL